MIDQYVLGIDFGSNSTSVSYYGPKGVFSLSLGDQYNLKTFPSLMAINLKTNQITTGYNARAVQYNEDYFIIKNLKERLVKKEPALIFKSSPLSIQFLISQLFLNLKEQVQLKLHCLIHKVVLTVPAYFSQESRHILTDSSKIAGLQVLRIINEPTSAAIYQAHVSKKDQTCLIVDVGGLTVDMSICNIMQGVIDVVCTYGDPTAGYGLIDESIYRIFLEKLKIEDPAFHQEVLSKKILSEQLKEFSEQVKIKHSDNPFTTLNLSKLFLEKQRQIKKQFTLTRAELLSAYEFFTERLENTYRILLQKSLVKEKEINKLLLVGAPTQSKMFRSLWKEICNVPLDESFNNITSVSCGAAIYGAQISGVIRSKVLSDVVPISIGVELDGGIFEKIIHSNMKIPIYQSAEFTTSEDFQPRVSIRIYQGERLLVKDCNFLGEIFLNDIEFNLKGCPIIKIILQYTSNGTINAFVMDVKTKNNAQLVINSKNRISEQEIEKIKYQAQKLYKHDLDFINLYKLSKDIEALQKLIDKQIDSLTDEYLLKRHLVLFEKTANVLNYYYKSSTQLTTVKEQLEDLLYQIKITIRENSNIKKKIS